MSSGDPPTIFVNGRITTMETSPASVEAVVVAGDRIIDVGPADLARGWPDAVQVDLGGRHLLPGFIDAHNHLSLAALEPRWADLAAVADLDALAAALRAQALTEPSAAWIRGTRWELEHDLPLTRHDLDALGLPRPVVVAHFSYHQCVVCSRGLDELGITASTPDPVGGTIDRDERGRPTGMLGTIAPGKRADLVVADIDDDELSIHSTWVDGRPVHNRSERARG